MIFIELIALVTAAAAVAFSGHLILMGTGRTKALAGAAAVGIMAVSQQFLIVVGGGLLQIALGLIKLKSKNPRFKKAAMLNIVLGLIMIGVGFYLYW